jgi:hypothetical protein
LSLGCLLIVSAGGDDSDAQYDAVQQWALERPTPPSENSSPTSLIWIDRACLDTDDINTSLACLPVFLAGCRRLLVLAGETYPSRLWCAMEIFVFVRMKGKHDEIDVRLILGPDKGAESAEKIKARLLRFDANKAECTLNEDRQRLLAAVESTYGTPKPFNKIVRDLLAEKVGGGDSARIVSTTSSTLEESAV